MKKFSEFLREDSSQRRPSFPSVTVTLAPYTFSIRFDSKDTVVESGYSGPHNIWLSSLCYLIEGKTLDDIALFTFRNWELSFSQDQVFCDLRPEGEETFFNPALELLKAAVTIFRGADYLYTETSPLICRCFGVREKDVIEELHKHEVLTIEALAEVTKAGMGCRSCVPQLNKWLMKEHHQKQPHFFKDRPAVDWLLEIDHHLSRFPLSTEWKMEVVSLKNQQVVITYDKNVVQKEEEEAGRELQSFLGAAVDEELSFFLSRARHFSKASR